MAAMESNTRKKLNLNTVSVSLGCGCSRPKLSLLFHPKPKLKTTKNPNKRQHQSHYSSSSSWTNDDDDEISTTTTTTTTSSSSTTWNTATTPLSPNDNISSKTTERKRKDKKKGFGRVGGEGVAVEKDSDDPYLDFRRSMLQMILENEIYSKDDLRELLNCFLELNSPSQHGIIVRAFTEIWDGVFSVRPSHQYNVQAKSSRDYYYY